MRRISTLLTTLAAAAILPTLLAATAGPASAGGLSNHEFESRVVHWINEHRADRGLRTVRGNACLDGRAETWAAKLNSSGGFYHQSMDAVLDSCSRTSWAGEVLGRGSATPRAWVRAWLHSKSHRALILKPRADRIGIGVKTRADGRRVLVGDLGDI